MKISLIVAKSKNNVIGKNNQLPWHLPADLQYFKRLTMGHHMIMGRKTFESIGKPLPGRTSIVITSNKDYSAPGCVIVHSLKEAINAAKKDEEVFIIGGAAVFSEALHLADIVYLTEIHENFEGDVYFPELDFLNWKLVKKEHHNPDEKNKYSYSFAQYERVK
jgi:dihydrofolate reductase